MLPRIFSLLVLCIVAFYPSGAAVHGAQFPIAAESLVKVGFHVGPSTSWLSGSVIHCRDGIVIVVTNSHGLRDGMDRASIIAPGIGQVPAELLCAGNPDNKRADLAIVAARIGRDLPPLRIARDPPQRGDRVHAAGFPLNAPAATAKSGSVVGFSGDGNLWASFASQSGDSGSPVVNDAGELVGVVWGSSEGQSSIVHFSHLLRLVETQCSGPNCTQIFGGPPMQILQPQTRQQIAGPDMRPMAQPALGGDGVPPLGGPAFTEPPKGGTPAFTQPPKGGTPAQAPALDYSRLADEILRDDVFFAQLGTDPRFVGPPGPPGQNGRDGIDAAAPSIDYGRIGSWIQETIPAAISAHDESKPIDWLGSLTTMAAAFGLNVAIPGGAFGLVAVKLAGAFLRHRLAMRQAQRNERAAEVGQAPFDRAGGGAGVPTLGGSVGQSQAEPTKVGTPAQTPAQTRTTRPATVSAEPMRPMIETRTEIVHVPTINLEAEALHEAMTRELKTFPTHAQIVKRIRSSAEQLLAGRNVTDNGRGPENKKGNHVGWSDE